MKTFKRRHPQAGISILEMMVVLGIMALVIGIVAPRAIGYFGRAKSATAEIQIKQIHGAMQLLYIDVGRYPSASEGVSSLLEAPPAMVGWRGPYLGDAAALNDPWGRAYVLEEGDENAAPKILTFGRDGQPGGSGEDSDIRL